MANGNPSIELFLPYIVTFLILIGLYFSFSIYFLIKYIKSNRGKTKKEKNNLTLACFSLSLFLGVGRVFLMLFDITTNFSSLSWGGEGFLLWAIGMTCSQISFGIFFIIIEKRVMRGRDRYLLVIIYFTIFVIGLILGSITIITISYLFSIFIPLGYFWVTFKSDGAVRKKAFSVAVGITLIMFASLLVTGYIINAIPIENIIIHTLSYIIKSVGAILFFLGLK